MSRGLLPLLCTVCVACPVMPRFAALISRYVAAWALAVSIPAFGEDGLDAADKIDRLNFRRNAESQKPQVQEVLNTPGWEDAAWKRIAELAVRSRYSKTNRSLADYEEQRKELEVRGRAEKARSELSQFIEKLNKLRDRRVVRLVGPLLEEDGENIDYGDYSFQRPADLARITLEMYHLMGLIGALPEGHDIAEWREWWRGNREQFGPPLSIPSAGGRQTPSPTLPVSSLPVPANSAAPRATADPLPPISHHVCRRGCVDPSSKCFHAGRSRRIE